MRSRRRRCLLAPALLLAFAPIAACGSSPDEGVQASASTTAARGAQGAESPAAGLTPAEVKAAVEAPAGTPTRALTGPVAERVDAGGKVVWRIRIPGTFTARSARAEVTVGDRSVGAAIEAPTLDALVAVTADGTGLVAGAPVTYRYGGGEPIEAGRLVVAR